MCTCYIECGRSGFEGDVLNFICFWKVSAIVQMCLCMCEVEY